MKHVLQKVLESSIVNPEIRSYSGRSMYGKECLGVIHSNVGMLFSDIILALSENNYKPEDLEELSEAFVDMRTDSMGRDDIIVYFPGVEFVDEDDEFEDEDEEAN